MEQKKGYRKQKTFFILIALIPLISYGMFSLYQHYVVGLPYFGPGPSIEQQTKGSHYQVPGFNFQNQLGEMTDSTFIQDKVWVADFFFTSCPSICPKMTTHLKEVQSAFQNEPSLRIVSFTVDPDRDNAERLNRYGRQHQIDPKMWSLLTGSKQELYRYGRKALFIAATDGDGGPDDFIHSDRLVLIDKNGHIRGYYDGTSDLDTKLLIADIKTLL